MTKIKIGAASVNQTPLDWNSNFNNIRRVIHQADKEGCNFLLLPELSITGYGCEDAFASEGLQGEALDLLRLVVSQCPKNMVVMVGVPVRHNHFLYNAVAVIYEGRVQGLTCKRHLANDGVHYESRWFHPWPEGMRDVFGPSQIPIGDLTYTLAGIRFGFEVCEDAWVADRPGIQMSKRGVDVIFNPSASHFAFGKIETRKHFVMEGSRAFGCTYVYANLNGNEAGRIIYDGGNLIATCGALVAAGERFSWADHTLTTAVVDLTRTRTAHSRTMSAVPQVGEDKLCIVLPVEDFHTHTQSDLPCSSVVTMPSMSKEAEFEAAMTLALHDYRRKSRAKGFVVSASGGVDSTVCLLLSSMAIAKSGIPAPLFGVYQGSANSSQTTLEAARAVVTGVGGVFYQWDVSNLIAAYTALVNATLPEPMTWESDDVTLQNIQARARAPGVWMLANKHGCLLLTTSNRSEAAVGYATMDGDTAGGLAPLAGIDKAFLSHWLRTKEAQYPFLRAVTAQVPTAELRPVEQSDETDLMPYHILDAIEKAAIRDKKFPEEAFATLVEQFPAIPSQVLMGYVRKFFRLWAINQWKRERYAVSFHLDDENLDPRSWCRFPVLNGGFETELRRLEHTL